MKNIVVGIDFSKTSILAFGYALNVARKTNSDLILINVQKHLDYEVPLAAGEKPTPESIHQQFETLVAKRRQDFPGRIEYTVREGKVHQEISNQAKYSDAWLVVMGAHGLSGFEEYWVGTDSYRVVATCMIPVITVRKGYDIHRNLQRVVIPIDSTPETVQKLPLTLDLAKQYGARIHLLSLYSSGTPSTREKVDSNTHAALRLVEMAGLDMVLNDAQAENLTTAAIEYARKVDADLISIMTEQEFAPHNIFLGPFAQQMVNRSPIPVLSLHAKPLVRENF
ncbi:MAG: universal stress protein [Bacteroides sp.]|jgi:nucleotide-binding universal stress UspA family protein|nr:universal stress protein [Bacteroides sp.]